MSPQEYALAQIWQIERDVVRRAAMVFAFPLLIVGRIVLTPVMALAVIAAGLFCGIATAVREIFDVLSDCSGEARMWRQFGHAWPMLWATSHARRPQPKLKRKPVDAP